MVIAPHADDESLGCGGLLLSARRFGNPLCVVLASHSDVVHREGKTVQGHHRVAEFRAVAEELCAECEVLPFEDRSLRQNMTGLIDALNGVMDRFEPAMVVFPFKSFHQDHAAVYDAVFACLRPGRAEFVETVVAYEVPNYLWYEESAHFMPNWYLSMTKEQVDAKLKLCAMYKSQMEREGTLIDVAQVVANAERRGTEAGLEYAEAYRIVKMIT